MEPVGSLPVGPSGRHLVGLLRNSDQALYTLLLLSGRKEMIAATKIMAVRDRLAQTVREIDALME